MGSLNASGISVVAKTNTAIRNRAGRQIYEVNSVDDHATTIVSSPPAHAIGSGSIVRANGTVTYTEEKVWGLQFGATSTSDRIASKVGNTRDLSVDIGDNQTMVVIPTSLTPDTPQLSIRHIGNKLAVGQAIGDVVVERVANSGSI